MMASTQAELWRGCGADGEDYRRACEVNDWLGVLTVGAAQALVIGADPTPLAELQVENRLFLARWLYGPSDEVVERHLLQAGTLDFPQNSVKVGFGSRTVMLFDAAIRGAKLEVEDALHLKLPGSICAFRTVEWEPDSETSLVLHTVEAAR